MSRPRKFPHHSDSPPRTSAENGRAYRPERLVGENPISDQEAKRLHQQAAHLAHPVPAGWCDPVSITLLLDLLLRLEHDSTIRSRHLTGLLTIEYPQFSWNAHTVGRILSELAEAAEACGATTEAPIERQLVAGGNRYVVHVNTLNWRWLWQVRDRMGRRAEQVIAIERDMVEFLPRQTFPHDVIAEVQWGLVEAA